jgi:multicomponent Na+:H+ antiporter subunit D
MLLTATMEGNRWPVAMLMLLSALIAVVYVWKVVETLYFCEPSEKAKQATEAPRSMLIPTYFVIGLTLVFGCWPALPVELAEAAANSLVAFETGGGQ